MLPITVPTSIARITAGMFFIRITVVIPMAMEHKPNIIMSFSLIPSLSLLPTAPPKRPPAKITIEFTITPIGTKNTLLHISIINLKMITSQIYPIIEAY